MKPRALGVLLFALLLSGCVQQGAMESAVPSSWAPESPTPTETAQREPPLESWMREEPVPDFLDADQQDLYLHAYSAASFLMGCETSGVDDYLRKDGSRLQWGEEPPEEIQMGDYGYLVSRGRFPKWADFQAMLDGVFSSEYQQELLSMDGDVPIFTATEDGRLCYIDASRGSDTDRNSNFPDSYELVSRTDNEICFNVIGYYSNTYPNEAQWETYEERDARVAAGYEYTKAYPIRMVLTDKGWRFAEFHVTY